MLFNNLQDKEKDEKENMTEIYFNGVLQGLERR